MLPRSSHHRKLLALGIVFAAALVLRLAHLWALKASFAGSDLFSIPLVDAEHHWKEARAILSGESPLAAGVPWKGPGYSWFLAGLAAIFGRSIAAVRWPLAVLGAVNCALLVLLARRVCDLRLGMVAGLLAAVNGILIVYDTEPYQRTMLITLNLGALLLLTGDRRGPLQFAGAGVLLGLAALVHPAYLLPAMFLAVWVGWRDRRGALFLACALAATLAPVTMSNVLRHGETTLVSWNGGVNVYAANHPTYDQRAGNDTQAWGRILRTPADAGIDSASARDRLYYRLTLERALRYPLATVGVLAKKTVVFLSPVEYSNNFRIYDLAQRSSVLSVLLGRRGPLWVPFGLWAPAALIGLAILLRGRNETAQLSALWALGVMLTNVLVFSTARYRAPVVFVGCIWAASALVVAWTAWRENRWRRLAGLALGFVLFGSLVAAIAVPQRSQPLPREWFQARALAKRGAVAEADLWVERAVARDPTSPTLLKFVSSLYGEARRRELQRDYLRRLLLLPDPEPDTVDLAHAWLAASWYAQQRFDEARDELLAAIAVGVDDARWRGYPHYTLGLGPIRECILRLRLADVEIRRGDADAARGELERVRAQCSPSPRLTGELESLESRLR